MLGFVLGLMFWARSISRATRGWRLLSTRAPGEKTKLKCGGRLEDGADGSQGQQQVL